MWKHGQIQSYIQTYIQAYIEYELQVYTEGKKIADLWCGMVRAEYNVVAALRSHKNNETFMAAL